MKKQNTKRYLRPLKLGKHTKEYYVFDTETGIVNKDKSIEYILSARPEHLIFGVVYGNNFKKVLYSVDEFKAEFLKTRYKNKLVFAHNAEYDLSAIYGNIYLLDRGAIFNGKFITCTNGNCNFADSYNILPTSVKKLGELSGLNKKQLGDNLLSHVNRLDIDVDYCTRDCEIVYNALKKVFAQIEPSYTIGSCSLKLFRKNYLKETIKVSPLSDNFFDALYGGRTEAFKIGECMAKVYDLNSAYPFVMKTKKFPDVSRLREIDYKYLRPEHEGMITANVNIPKNEVLPILPYRYESRLIFPTGKFTGSWTLPEFRYAMKNSDMSFVPIKVIVSEPIASPFKSFISDLWKLRSNTDDEFERYYYKLFMNNLFGKMIQRARDEYRFCENMKEIKTYLNKNKIKKSEVIPVQSGYFLRYELSKIFQHTIAPFGAYITSYVRIMLHELMKENFKSLIYCDTDSVFLEKSLKLNSKELGGWKLEPKTVTNIRALKDYVYFDEIEKSEKQMLKGVKHNAKQFDMEGNVFKYKRMIKTKESFRRTDNLPPGTFIDQIKVITGDYKKRITFKDGTTKPIHL